MYLGEFKESKTILLDALNMDENNKYCQALLKQVKAKLRPKNKKKNQCGVACLLRRKNKL